MSWAIEQVAPGLTWIALPHPGVPAPWGLPHNVYLLTAPDAPPALVGTGHPGVQRALDDALATLGLRRAAIRRIVALDWTPDQIGAAHLFPRADVFAASPDMVEPRRYGAWLERQRSWLRAWAEALRTDRTWAEALDFEEVEVALRAYWTSGLPETLDVIPLRERHVLALADRTFRVLGAPGPADGHIALHQEGALLFAGRALSDTSLHRLEVQDMIQLLLTLESLLEANAPLGLPTRGRVERDVRWTLRRVHRHMTNLLSTIPLTLRADASVLDIMRNDLGYVPRHAVRALTTARTIHACFAELVRTGVVTQSGEGLLTRYSTDAVEERLQRA